MKKFYCIFVVSVIYLNMEYNEYPYGDIYSGDPAIKPYYPQLFETEEDAEKFLEEVAPNDKEYKDCQFIIQKVYVRDNS